VWRGKDRNQPSIGFSPRSTTDTVHILLVALRHVVINDRLDPRNIETSARQVRRQQKVHLVVPKLFQSFKTLELRQVTVQFGSFQAQETKDNLHIVCSHFGSEKDDGFGLVRPHHQGSQNCGSVRVVFAVADPDEFLDETRGQVAVVVDKQPNGAVQGKLDEIVDLGINYV